jgi:hypothetical protein
MKRRLGRERTSSGRFSPVRTKGVVESRVLWAAELQHEFPQSSHSDAGSYKIGPVLTRLHSSALQISTYHIDAVVEP